MNDEQIIKMYVQDNKSTYEISKEFKTYPNKIRRLLKKHGIELKNKSEAQKNALQNGTSSIPTQGRVRTYEEKLKISSGMIDRWANISEEEYQKHVNEAKERWENLSEETKEEMRKSANQAIRAASKEGSKLEKEVRTHLEKRGYEVKYHYMIPNTSLEIDLYLPALKTIIEIDGISHFKPIWGEEKFREQIKFDLKKTGIVLGQGLVMFRVKHIHTATTIARTAQVLTEVDKVLNIIEKKFPKESERYIEVEI